MLAALTETASSRFSMLLLYDRLVQNTAIPVSIPESTRIDDSDSGIDTGIDSWIDSTYKRPLNKPAIQLSQPPN